MIEYLIILLGIVFITSSISKFIDNNEFRKTLFDIGIPRKFINTTSILIPVYEFISVMFLLLPYTQFIGSILMLLILLSFLVVSTQAILQKKKIDCNCFGSLIPGKLGWSTIIRSFFLMLITIYVLVSDKIQLYSLPFDILLYKLFTSLGIFSIYAVVSKIIYDIQSARKVGM